MNQRRIVLDRRFQVKIFHISDLHIGKQLNYYSLKENQQDILNQIIEKIKIYRPDVLLIAGDIFDKSMPSGEAYTLFDDFLNQLAQLCPSIPVCMIAGNHDSPERLNYASAFMEKHQIYVSVMPPMIEDEHMKKIVLKDAFGAVNIYLLPFTKPGYVRLLFTDTEISDYESAIRCLIEREAIDTSERNILVSHQFYQSSGWETKTCDSEQVLMSIGGLDRIDTSVLKDFDYVALGHLHGPQKIKEERIRYSGSPLKYSVSEEHQKKSITMVTMERKNKPLRIEMIPLEAKQDVRSEKGTLEEILAKANEKNVHDFIRVTLTDEHEPYRMKEKLREVYDFVLEIHVDNTRTRQKLELELPELENRTPFEVFRAFYEDMSKAPMTENEEDFMKMIFEQIAEDME